MCVYFVKNDIIIKRILQPYPIFGDEWDAGRAPSLCPAAAAHASVTPGPAADRPRAGDAEGGAVDESLLVHQKVARVGERGQRGARGRRRVGQTRVQALRALVHDRPRLEVRRR